MAYLKYTSAPPELFIGQRNVGGRLIRAQRYCQQSFAVLYTLDGGDRQEVMTDGRSAAASPSGIVHSGKASSHGEGDLTA